MDSPIRCILIVYRELTWYNADIEPMMALYVPEFCTGMVWIPC